MKAKLILEDGKVFHGFGCGTNEKVYGEVVTNTAMVGYQEVITDPANAGLIVCMTYPLIGNYGVNEQDSESLTPQAKGIVCREFCDHPSNWRCESSIYDYMQQNRLTGLEGVDTRALTRYLRHNGPLQGAIAPAEEDDNQILGELREMN